MPTTSMRDYSTSSLRQLVTHTRLLLQKAFRELRDLESIDLNASMDALADIKRARRTASALEHQIEDAAIAEMSFTGDEHYRGSDYIATFHSGRTRKKWMHEQIIQEIIEQRLDAAVAKYPGIPKKMLRALITENVWEMAKCARLEWRGSALKERGIDPNTHSVIGRSSPNIEIVGGGGYAHIPDSRRK